MLIVAVVSLVVVPTAQNLAVRQTLNKLAPDFRERVLERTEPSAFGRGRRGEGSRSQEGDRQGLNSQDFDDQLALVQEVSRLFTLLGDYRDAQRRTVLFGSALALLLATLLALWLARGIARPIEAVSAAASELAGGNLSTRVALGTLRFPSSETVALANDFNHMAASLEQLEEERKAMIADIAHELRNPLATLQLRLDSLRDGLVPFDLKEADVLAAQTGLITRLVTDLRTLSLADAKRLSLHPVHVDLAQLLSKVVESYQAQAEQQGVRLEVQVPDRPAYTHADPDRLRQVFRNLLDNAFNVTEAGGAITVLCEADETTLVVGVRDTGPGIPEADLEGIFERFVQGQRRDTGQQGSGLGLAIVKTLVELQGGTVGASTYEGGAQLEVTLPRLNNSQTNSR